MTPARTSSSRLTTSTQIGKASVIHMLMSLAIRRPTRDKVSHADQPASASGRVFSQMVASEIMNTAAIRSA